MLLELITKYGKYCSLAGESAGDFETYLLGWLTEAEARELMTEIQRCSIPSCAGLLIRIVG